MYSLRLAIMQTLRYSDYFSYPLTISELHTRLIYNRPVSGLVLKRAVNKMRKSQEIGKFGEYYYLPGSRSHISRRNSRTSACADLYADAGKKAKELGILPGVIAIYLTGSLAMKNCDKEGDIDLMVITKNGQLWTTRLLLTIYTSIRGLRRTPGSTHNAGKLCLNLYLTPQAFSLPRSRRSLYTAYELIQAVPLYDPSNTHASLLTANAWVKKYLANYHLPPRSKPREQIRPSVFAIYTEKVCYYAQRAYMSHRITREFITPDSAFFHPLDISKTMRENSFRVK